MTDASASRGRSFSQRKKSGFVARIRSRSASINRANRRGSSQQNVNSEHDPLDSSGHLISNQIEDIVERHQLALKMDMIELMEAQEKEAKFWKNKAAKLKKRLSSLGKESGDHIESAERDEELQYESPFKDAEQKELIERIAILERQVQDRDAQIESLRGTMEAQEKANEDRVRLLENQLERLVEIKQKVRRGSCQTNSSTAPTELMSSDIDILNTGTESNLSDSDHTNNNGKRRSDPRHEISALEQLLARVLAEKDKLSFENANLRSVVRETVPSSTDMTSTSNDVEHEICSTKTSPGTTYQLSCRNCDGQHFMSETSMNLKKVAKEHFSMVWHVVQSTNRKCVTVGNINDNSDPSVINCEFTNSSLAHHLANHCKEMTTEQEVRKWCKKNVKLEKITGDPFPDSDLGRSCEF